jgi:hypothetical protein
VDRSARRLGGAGHAERAVRRATAAAYIASAL